MILIFGGLLGTVLSVMTVAITLTFAWLTASGKWDGTIEAGDRSFAIDPMLETVLAWVIVGALFIANIGFYYLVVRLYRGR